MSSLVSALDSHTPTQIGEKGHLEYTWSNDTKERILQLSSQIVRMDKDHLKEMELRLTDLIRILSKQRFGYDSEEGKVCNEHLSLLYRLIGQTRDVIDGKGEYQISYMMLWTWYKSFPQLALYALETFVTNDKDSDGVLLEGHPYGSWKDIKYFAQYCIDNGADKNHPIIQKCVSLINEQLVRDMEAMASEKSVSLCGRWVPRENSKYAWLFKVLALDFYKNSGFLESALTPDKKDLAVKKMCMQYRKMCSSLNKYLDTVQIKQCARTWAEIDHNKTTSITLSKNKKAFLNKTKSGEVRSQSDDRIACADNFKNYVASRVKEGKEVKGARVGMENFVKQALELIDTNWQHNMASVMTKETLTSTEGALMNSQWRDKMKSVGNLGKMIAMADVSGSMFCDLVILVSIALSLCVAEKSILGKRVMTFDTTPTWHNLEHCDTFLEQVDSIRKAKWGGSTNFFGALDLILQSLVEKNIPPEDVKGLVLAIFSDMQIDSGHGGFGGRQYMTMYSEIEQRYLAAGYEVPHILFWNLRATNGFPCLSTQSNTSMMSGYSPALLNLFCEKGVDALQECTPWSNLVESLSVPRYEKLAKFYNDMHVKDEIEGSVLSKIGV